MTNSASAEFVSREDQKSTRTPKEKTSNGSKNERVTVRITGDLGEAIKEIQGVTNMTSPSEVVRRAILVHHALVKQKLEGNEPVIVIKNEESEKLVPIFL